MLSSSQMMFFIIIIILRLQCEGLVKWESDSFFFLSFIKSSFSMLKTTQLKVYIWFSFVSIFLSLFFHTH